MAKGEETEGIGPGRRVRLSYNYPTSEDMWSIRGEEDNRELEKGTIYKLLNNLPYNPPIYNIPRFILRHEDAKFAVTSIHKYNWSGPEVKIGPFTFEVITLSLGYNWRVQALINIIKSIVHQTVFLVNL